MPLDRQMLEIDEDGFRKLVSGCQVIEEDRLGAKVYLSSDGMILKVFRLKRLLSSALLFPYAIRFANNADRLRRLQIPTLEVDTLYRLRARRQHIARYRRLPGETLRLRVIDNSLNSSHMSTLARYLARLHDKGVYFRSIHFGNVIVDEAGAFALIDVTDTRFKGRPLRNGERARNFRHLLRYPEDRQALARFGNERFVHEYLQATNLQLGPATTLSTRILGQISSQASSPIDLP